MRQIRTQQGFTLIELLVVIGIIVILAAILYPVFGAVREKAKQAQCRSNLQQIATALKMYRQEHGRYPFPPYYDTVAKRWLGGVSALYPDYVNSKALLICPDDRQISSRKDAASDAVYSSYNGMVEKTTWDWETTDCTNPDGGAALAGAAKRTYNYYGYCQEGYDVFDFATRPFPSTRPLWLTNEGLSWRHYPRLYNRNAPDNTIITRCLHHENFFKRETSKLDPIVTLGGQTDMVNVSQMSKVGADEAHPSPWVSQK